MRLAFKIFLAQSLAVLVVGAVAYWSITEIGKLQTSDRASTTRTASALRLEVSMRESMREASDLERRFVVFGDREYASRPSEVAREIETGLTTLALRLTTELEQARLREARESFVAFRD